jgi:hypothetical protein
MENTKKEISFTLKLKIPEVNFTLIKLKNTHLQRFLKILKIIIIKYLKLTDDKN